MPAHRAPMRTFLAPHVLLDIDDSHERWKPRQQLVRRNRKQVTARRTPYAQHVGRFEVRYPYCELESLDVLTVWHNRNITGTLDSASAISSEPPRLLQRPPQH